MAANTVSLTLQVNSNLKQETQDAEKYNSALQKAKSTAASFSKSTTAPQTTEAIKKASMPITEQEYGKVRGTVGTGAAGRDFAKQAQGLGGLVALYATFAANIFAVGAAYEALNKAAATERLTKATELMSIATGIHLKSVSKNLVEASGYALSFSEAMQFTNIGTSAGLAASQIESLTKIAKGAASALGRDVGDSIRRIIQGTAKQEQEILDELGIFVKASQAYEKFAAANKIKVADLTGAQRTQAYANEVERLGQKWTAFAEIPDPFSKFAATGKNALNDLLVSINKVFSPLLSYLAESEDAIKGIILLVATMLTKRAIPEVGNLLVNMFTFDKARIAKEAADAQQVLITTYNTATAELAAAKKARDALLIPTLEKGTFKEILGTTAYTSPKNQGVNVSRLSAAFIGTEKNPLETLGAYSKIELVTAKITDTLKEQLKDSSYQDALLKSLIDKKIIENTLSAESITLGKEGELIAGRIFTKISETNSAKAAGLLLDKEVVAATSAEALARKNIKGISEETIASKTIGPVSAAANTSTTASNTAMLEANTAAKLANTAATTKNTVTEVSNSVPIVANTGFVTAYTRALATSAESKTLLAAAGGSLGAQLKVLAADFMLAATAAGAAAMGEATLAAAGVFLGSASKMAATGIKALLMAINWLLIPVMLLVTAWELFGDKLANFLPESAQVALGMGEIGKAAEKAAAAQKDFAEGTGLAAISLMNLNKARQGNIESLSEAANLDKIEASAVQEQIARIKKLSKEKTDAAEAETLAKLKAKSGEGFSASAMYLEQLAKSTTVTEAEASALQKLAKEQAAVDRAIAGGYGDREANIKQQKSLQTETLAVLDAVAIRQQQELSSKDKLKAANTALETSYSKLLEKMANKGNEKLALVTPEAVTLYNSLTTIFDTASTSALRFESTQATLIKMMVAGGKTAAAAAPLYALLAQAMNAGTSMKEGRIVTDMAKVQEFILANKKEFDKLNLALAGATDVKPKSAAIKPYDDAAKNKFAAMKDQIDAITLSIQTSDIALSNRKAIDARIEALQGYATAESIAANLAAENSKAKDEYLKSEKQAQLELSKVLLDKSKIGKEGVEARSQAQKDYDNKIAELKLTRSAREQAALQAEDAAKVNKIANEYTKNQKDAADQQALLTSEEQLRLNTFANTLELAKELGLYSEKELTTEQNKLDVLKQEEAAKAAIRSLGESQASALAKPLAEMQSTEPEIQAKAAAEVARINALYKDKIILQQTISAQDLTHLTALGAIKLQQASNNEEMTKMVEVTTTLTSLFGEMGTNIGKAGEAILKMSQDDDKYAKQKLALQEKISLAERTPGADITGLKKEEISLEKKATKDKLSNIAATANASKKMFKEHTVAYKVLDGLEKASHIMQMVNMATELGAMLSGLATSVSALFVAEAQTGAAKVPNVLMSFVEWMGPWGVAAGAAFLASIGMSGKGGGGTVNTAGLTSADRQSVQGTGMRFENGVKVETGGGVFGDSSAKSTAIADSLEVMKANSIEGLDYDNKMLKALEKLANSVTGAAKSLYSIPGIRQGTNFGTMEGSGVTNAGFGASIPVVGKLLSSIFGGKTTVTTSILSAGLQFKGTFDQVMNNVTGSILQYKDVLTQTTKKGGWFSKDKSSSSIGRETTALAGQVSQAFSDIFGDANELFLELGKKTGVTATTISNVLKDFDAALDIDVRGLSGDELLAEINGVIGSVLSDVSRNLFVGFEKFRNFGEDYLETVIRVVDGSNKVDMALRSMGSALPNLTESLVEVPQSLLEAQALAKKELDEAAIAKTTEGMTTATTSMFSPILLAFQKFGWFTSKATTSTLEYTEALKKYEEATVAVNNATGIMTTRNFDMTEALIKAAGSLENFMSQANFFTENFLSDAERLAPIRLSVSKEMSRLGLSLSTTKTDFKNLVLAQNLSTVAGREMYQSLMDLAPGFNAVIEGISDGIQDTISELESSISRFREFAQTLKAFRDSLVLSASSTATPLEKYAEAKTQFESTYALALSGDKDAMGKLTSISQTFLDMSKTVFASSAQYTQDYNMILTKIGDASNSALATATIAELQLQATKDSISLLTTINENIAIIAGVPAAAGGGRVSGLTLVGEMGPELVDFTSPGQVYTADQTAGMFSGTMTMGPAIGAMLSEIQQLRAEVSQLRKDQQKQTGDIIISNYDANQKASDEIATAVVDAATTSAWAERSKSTID